MSRLSTEKKATVLGALLEGTSIRTAERMTGVSRNTIGRLMLQWGRASERLLDETIRDFECEQIEADEQWMYIQKRRHRKREGDLPEVGDAWIWSAVDPDSKLIPAHHVGKRKLADAQAFARRRRRRLACTPQFNTDRLNSYKAAIWGEFSTYNEETEMWERPDWGTVVKHFEVQEPRDQGRYVPPRMARMERRVESGTPDEGRISTSHVEAHHLQFRMRNKRAARMTNAASKTHRHLRASVATYYAHYNLCRRHSTIRTAPAVEAGLIQRPWTLPELIEWGDMYGR